MTVNSLHASMHCCGVSPCHCACITNADSAHRALHFASPSHVQTACATAPPACRSREPKRPAKAEGKIKGRSTKVCAKPVCTGEECGTRHQRHRAAISFNALSAWMNPRARFA